MSIQIDLSPEVVQKLQTYSASQGKTPEQTIQELVAEKINSLVAPPKFSKEEFAERISKIIKAHPRVPHQVDVSRDSIYD